MEVQNVLNDPDFQGLPLAERAKVLKQIDPDFAGLPISEQGKVLNTKIQTPTNNTADYPQGIQPQDAARMRQQFINQEKDNKSVGDYVQQYRKPAVDLIRPTLEGIGSAIGSVASIPGEATGYATGKWLADFAEGIPQSWQQTTNDIKTGAQYAMAGGIAGKALGGLVDFAKKVKAGNVAIPYTQAWSKRKAAEALDSALPTTANPETDAVMKRIGATNLNLTPAQKTGSQEMARIEQSMIAKNRDLDAAITTNNSKIYDSAYKNLTNTLGDSNPLPIANTPLTAIGNDIVAGIKQAAEPVRQASREAWDAVPTKYTMDTGAIDQAFKDALAIPSKAEPALKEMYSIFQRTPKTVAGIRRLETEITDTIRHPQTDNTVRKFLGDIKTAINTQYDDLGRAAETGDIAVFDGKLIKPSELQNSIAKIEQSIAGESSRLSASPDIEAIAIQLRDKGLAPNHWMQVTNESPQLYASRLAKTYEANIGPDIPMTGTATTPYMQQLQDQTALLKNQLNSLTPAEDAALAIKNAKAATIKESEMFRTGAVKNTLARGDEISGLNQASDDVAQSFWGEQSTRDLVRAVGAAKTKAMLVPYVKNQMLSMTDNHGVLNATKAQKWIRTNQNILKNSGTYDDAVTTIREQIPLSIQSRIKSHLKTDGMDNPVVTAREALKLTKEFIPIFKLAYGKDAIPKMRALNDWQKTVQILSRNQNVTKSGSNTADKIFGDIIETSRGRQITEAILAASVGGGIGYGLQGAMGGVAGAVGANALFKGASANAAFAKTAAQTFMKDAITNPETAEMLLKMVRGKKIPPTVINDRMIKLGLIGTRDNQ